jgi:predicted glycoside hydrolase/deacetylase ChbG (UPF0249 family)
MKIIINADDFGLTSGVNQAIIECHKAGSLSSTTLMVNTKATTEAAALAKAHPHLGVGLHFNLTLGTPICDPNEVPSLVNNKGQFFSRTDFELRMLLGRLHKKEIQKELQAQFDCFMDMGLKMTHIDSHQHVHLFPSVFNEVASLSKQVGLPLRMPWIWGDGKKGHIKFKRRLRLLVLRQFVKSNVSKWQGQINFNKDFGSVFDIHENPQQINLESYLRLIKGMRRYPAELMVHPAYVCAELKQLTRITDYSEAERQILLSHNLGKIITKMGGYLVNFAMAFK